MKTLTEVLRDALILLGDEARDHVVIARGHQDEPLGPRSQAFQIRLHRDHDYVWGAARPVHRCETRRWLIEEWSSWSESRGWLGGAGFDIDDVLATDWRVVS